MDKRCFSLKFFKIVLDKAKPKNYTIEKHRGESKTPTRESKKCFKYAQYAKQSTDKKNPLTISD